MLRVLRKRSFRSEMNSPTACLSDKSTDAADIDDDRALCRRKMLPGGKREHDRTGNVHVEAGGPVGSGTRHTLVAIERSRIH
ncbi:MAG: hypothetical protein R3E09_06730 [Novosphingobium sp.]